MLLNIHSFVRSLTVSFLLIFAANTYAESEPVEIHAKPLKLGYFPLISTVALYKRFAPLRDYLSDSLGREVVLLTAKDFPTFFKRTAERQYDIVVTAPHFAVSAADSGKYRIRSTLIKDVQQLIVVKENSPIVNIEQLAGKTIATPPKRALMTMMGKLFLKNAGITGSKSPTYRSFTSHNAANQALLGGEVDAAIASTNIVRKAIRRGEPLKIIGYGLKLPNMATLVATDQDAVIGDRVVKALTNMTHTDKGKEILGKISFPGYREVSAKDYEVARPYLEQAKAMSAE